MEDYSKVKVWELVLRNDDHPYVLNGCSSVFEDLRGFKCKKRRYQECYKGSFRPLKTNNKTFNRIQVNRKPVKRVQVNICSSFQ